MKRFSLLFVMLGCGLLVACTEDVYNEERVKEDYTQHFVDLFGSIDANQDWNMAEQKSVMVEPGTVSDIRIYAKNGEINKLVGYYQEISGKQTLTFDAAKAVNDFVVTAGGQARWVKNGESVSFAHVGTRGYETSVEDVFTVNSEYKVFTKEEVMAFASFLGKGEIVFDCRFPPLEEADQLVFLVPEGYRGKLVEGHHLEEGILPFQAVHPNVAAVVKADLLGAEDGMPLAFVEAMEPFFQSHNPGRRKVIGEVVGFLRKAGFHRPIRMLRASKVAVKVGLVIVYVVVALIEDEVRRRDSLGPADDADPVSRRIEGGNVGFVLERPLEGLFFARQRRTLGDAPGERARSKNKRNEKPRFPEHRCSSRNGRKKGISL